MSKTEAALTTSHVKFVCKGRKTARHKTMLWHVYSLTSDTLGGVMWERGWRQYVFTPAPMTIFSADCLRDVATFVQRETDRHKGPTVPNNLNQGDMTCVK